MQQHDNEQKMLELQGDEFLNRIQATKILKISGPTFDKLRRQGLIPFVEIGPIRRYRKSDLLSIGRK